MKGICQCKWCHMRESENLIITSSLSNFWTVSMRTKLHIVGTCGSERTPKQHRAQHVLPTAIKTPTEEHQSTRWRGNFRRVFVWSPNFMNLEANCVVRGSVKRRYGMQDAEVQGATWTRRLVTSRMSEASIEKLCATERNYVSVGWRTLGRDEWRDTAASYSDTWNVCLHSAYLDLVYALVQSTPGCCVAFRWAKTSGVFALTFQRF